jgi:hypothetical protein
MDMPISATGAVFGWKSKHHDESGKTAFKLERRLQKGVAACGKPL